MPPTAYLVLAYLFGTLVLFAAFADQQVTTGSKRMLSTFWALVGLGYTATWISGG